MKTTFSGAGWTRHALCFGRDGNNPHWHLASRSDGFTHPHWAKVAGLIFPGWRPRSFKVYRAGFVDLWVWRFSKKVGWRWLRAAIKTADGWRRTLPPERQA